MMYKRGHRVTALLVASPLAMLASVEGCRSPTEVSLDLSTDVPCSSFTGSAISVGTQDSVETKPPATTTTTCNAAGTIGTLVIVPSGSDDAEITIRVAGGVNRDPETCTDDAADLHGCIVSRRAVRFIDHTPLTLDIPLRSACIGVVCGETQTCVEGACVSDVVPSACGTRGEACGEAQLDLDGGPPADAGADAGAADATVDAAAEGGPTSPNDAATDAPTVDAADAAPDGQVAFTPPVCADGTEPGALWPVTGRCSNHDSHTTLVGVTAGTVFCNTSSGVVEAPLAIDAAGHLYSGDASGLLRVYDASLKSIATYALGHGQITSVAVVDSSTVFVASATALSRVLLGFSGQAVTTLVQGQAPLPLVVATNGDVVTGDDTAIDAYGAKFPAPAWTYLAPNTVQTAPYPVSVATLPNGSLVSSWQNEGALYPLTNSGAAMGDPEPSVEPTGYLLLGGAGGTSTYTWNDPGLALVNGDESDITSIVGVAVTSTALAVTSNPTNQKGMFSLFDPVTIKPIVQTALAQGATVVSAPAVDGNDTVYFLSSDGVLHVRLVSGADMALPATGVSTTSAPPPIIGNGVVYVGGLSGGGLCMYK